MHNPTLPKKKVGWLVAFLRLRLFALFCFLFHLSQVLIYTVMIVGSQTLPALFLNISN